MLFVSQLLHQSINLSAAASPWCRLDVLVNRSRRCVTARRGAARSEWNPRAVRSATQLRACRQAAYVELTTRRWQGTARPARDNRHRTGTRGRRRSIRKRWKVKRRQRPRRDGPSLSGYSHRSLSLCSYPWSWRAVVGRIHDSQSNQSSQSPNKASNNSSQQAETWVISGPMVRTLMRG